MSEVPLPTAQIGPHRLEERLGSSEVFRARDTRLDRWVAARRVPSSPGHSAQRLRHVPGEPRAARQTPLEAALSAARLEHPGIARTYDVVQHAGGSWIIMEFIDGVLLSDCLGEGDLAPDLVLSWSIQLADALREAHREGVTHGNLKAKNILREASGQLRILDFGCLPQSPVSTGSPSASPHSDPSTGSAHSATPRAYALGPSRRADVLALGSLFAELAGAAPGLRQPAAPTGSKDKSGKSSECGSNAADLDGFRQGFWRIIQSLHEDRAASHEARSLGEIVTALRRLEDELPARDCPDNNRIPAAVNSRAEIEGEVRQLTVLDLELVAAGSSPQELDATSAYEVIGQFDHEVQQILQELDGHLEQSFGHRIVACFGYPRAQEDAASRAIQAAFRIVARCRAVNPEGTYGPRIGVHSGEATVILKNRRRRLRLGATSEHAARLRKMAGLSDVLTSTPTLELARGRFRVERLEGHGPDNLRSHDRVQGVEILRALPLEAGSDSWFQTQPLTDLIGRDDELGLLRERLSFAERGSGQIVYLTGEAGIGKSRLVTEFRQDCKSRGVRFFRAECFEQNRHVAFDPLITLLRRLAEIPEARPEHGRRYLRRFLKRRGLADETSLELFLELLEGSQNLEAPTRVQLAPEAKRERFLDALAQVFSSFAQRGPIVLIIEDIHWADPSTADFLNYLIDRIGQLPILMLATSRLDPPQAEPCRLGSERHREPRPNLSTLRLGRLSKLDITQLIARLSAAPLSREIIEQIIAKTDGVPFFVEEYTRLLSARRAVQGQDSDHAPNGRLEGSTIPAALRDMLAARLDALGDARPVAQMGAVLGREFSFDLLLEVSQADAARIERKLDRLIEASLLIRRGSLERRRYRFRHALLRDTAYDSMLKKRRRALHRRAALAFERRLLGAEEAGEAPARYLLPQLALHCRESGDLPGAFRYFSRAAEEALTRFANREAIRLYREASMLDLQDSEISSARLSGGPAVADETHQLAILELNLARALVNCSDYHAALGHLEKGVELLGYPVPKAAAGTASGLLAQLFQQIRRRLLSQRLQARSHHSSEALRKAAAAYELLVEIYYYRNSPMRSLHAALRALNLAEIAGHCPERSRSFALMAVLAGNISMTRMGDFYCEKALTDAGTLLDPANFALVAIVTAVYQMDKGDLKEAHRLFQKSADISQELGDHRRWFDAAGNLAMAELLRGRLQVAKKLRVRLEETASRLDDARYQSASIRTRTILQLYAGDEGGLESSCDELEELRTETAPLERDLEELDRLVFPALWLVRQARHREALSRAIEASAVASKISPSHTFYTSLFAFAALAEVALEVWEAYRASSGRENFGAPHEAFLRKLADRSCKALLSCCRTRKIMGPAALLYRGRFLWLDGKADLAHRIWLRGKSQAMEMGLPYFQALIDFEIGKSLGREEAKGREHSERAARIFLRIGAEYDLKRSTSFASTVE